MRKIALVLAYQHRDTIVEAVLSIVNQSVPCDLIVVSDDSSSDGTHELLQKTLLETPKLSAVKLRRTDQNLGLIGHLNWLINSECKDGDLIFINAGDDTSHPDRVRSFMDAYFERGSPRYFLGHSCVTVSRSTGDEILVPPIAQQNLSLDTLCLLSAYHIGATEVFTYSLFADFGPICFSECYEDLVLGYRALLTNSYCFLSQALVRYKEGGMSSWQKNLLRNRRARHKATLMQRIIDSTIAGKTDNLQNMADSFSQYGFGLTPHGDRVTVLRLKNEGPLPSRLYSFLNSEHLAFNVFSVVDFNSNSFQIDYLKSELLGHGKNIIVWICIEDVMMNFSEDYVIQLREYRVPIVIELSHVYRLDMSAAGQGVEIVNVINRLASEIPLLFLQVACIEVGDFVANIVGTEKVSYCPPLFDIDGPDPERVSRSQARYSGAVVGVDGIRQSTLDRMQSAKERVTQRQGVGCRDLSLDVYNCSPGNSELLRIDDFDFLIIVVSDDRPRSGFVDYWWAAAASRGIPVFLISRHSNSEILKNGVNILYVSDSDASWSTLFELILTQYSALKSIAFEARRVCFFSFSVQKNMHRIVGVFRSLVMNSKLFDKFFSL